jgi:hypothetical protein
MEDPATKADVVHELCYYVGFDPRHTFSNLPSFRNLIVIIDGEFCQTQGLPGPHEIYLQPSSILSYLFGSRYEKETYFNHRL